MTTLIIKGKLKLKIMSIKSKKLYVIPLMIKGKEKFKKMTNNEKK